MKRHVRFVWRRHLQSSLVAIHYHALNRMLAVWAWKVCQVISHMQIFSHTAWYPCGFAEAKATFCALPSPWTSCWVDQTKVGRVHRQPNATCWKCNQILQTTCVTFVLRCLPWAQDRETVPVDRNHSMISRQGTSRMWREETSACWNKYETEPFRSFRTQLDLKPRQLCWKWSSTKLLRAETPIRHCPPPAPAPLLDASCCMPLARKLVACIETWLTANMLISSVCVCVSDTPACWTKTKWGFSGASNNLPNYIELSLHDEKRQSCSEVALEGIFAGVRVFNRKATATGVWLKFESNE